MKKNDAIRHLKEQIERADLVLKSGPWSDEFQQWHSASEAVLRHVFAKNPEYVGQWKNISFSLGACSSDTPQSAFDGAYFGGVRESKNYLIARLDEVERFWSAQDDQDSSNAPPVDPRVVFVIHGRQKLTEVHSFLRALGLVPLEWSQARRITGKSTPLTWEIVDTALREAGAIVVLFTADDEARLREDLWGSHESVLEKQVMNQPRQNVLFEAGVAYGRAPQRTVMIRIGGNHRPISDLAGHHLIQLTNDGASRQEVADALRNAGCPVDTTGTDWLKTGDFSNLD